MPRTTRGSGSFRDKHHVSFINEKALESPFWIVWKIPKLRVLVVLPLGAQIALVVFKTDLFLSATLYLPRTISL